MAAVDKVVLAYSGGLDTSVILKWLEQTYGCEVVTFTADLGQGEELEPARTTGRGDGCPRDLHRGPPRAVRRRVRIPDVSRQRDLRGRVPARHLDRPTPHRQAARGDRPRDRGRRREPWCHRQGQRPGPVRAGGVRARARDPGHRPLAGVGPHQPRDPAGLRRGARDPRRDETGDEVTVLDGRQPLAHLLRGRSTGGSLDRAAERDVALVDVARARTERGSLPRAQLPGGRHRGNRRCRD